MIKQSSLSSNLDLSSPMPTQRTPSLTSRQWKTRTSRSGDPGVHSFRWTWNIVSSPGNIRTLDGVQEGVGAITSILKNKSEINEIVITLNEIVITLITLCIVNSTVILKHVLINT